MTSFRLRADTEAGRGPGSLLEALEEIGKVTPPETTPLLVTCLVLLLLPVFDHVVKLENRRPS